MKTCICLLVAFSAITAPLLGMFGAGGIFCEKYEWEISDEHFEAFTKAIAKKYKMKWLVKGVGTCVDSKIVAWDFNMIADRQWTIEQARPVIQSIMDEFWTFVNSDPEIVKHMQRQGSTIKWYDPVLTPKRLGLRLTFWDKNVNRPMPPNVAQIIVAEGQVRYYKANPDQSLGQPYIESWQPTQLKS